MEDQHAVVLQGHRGFFGIYDGHAGEKAAEYTAEHLHRDVLALYDKHKLEGKPPPSNEDLADAVMALDSKMSLAEAGEGVDYGGTTAVFGVVHAVSDAGAAENKDGESDASAHAGASATVDGDPTEAKDPSDGTERGVDGAAGDEAAVTYNIIVGNVGDSRALLGRRDGTFKEMSFDHKPDLPKETDRIIQCGGNVTNNRVNGGLAVSRALGDFASYKNPQIPQQLQQVSEGGEAFPATGVDVNVAMCRERWES